MLVGETILQTRIEHAKNRCQSLKLFFESSDNCAIYRANSFYCFQSVNYVSKQKKKSDFELYL